MRRPKTPTRPAAPPASGAANGSVNLRRVVLFKGGRGLHVRIAASRLPDSSTNVACGQGSLKTTTTTKAMTLLGARSRPQPQSVGVNTIAYTREQQVGDAPLFGPRAVVFAVAFIERRAEGRLGRRVRAPRSGNPDGQTSTTLKETAPSQIHEPPLSWSFQLSQTPGGCRSDGGFRATHSRRTYKRTLRANFAAPAVYNIGALSAGTARFSDYLRAR